MAVTALDVAAALIAVFEGERLEAYQDSGGVWTIGFGHTKGVKMGDVITHEQSVLFFGEDTAPLITRVLGRPPLEGGALLSFGYNCGGAALQKIIDGRDWITSPVHCTDHKGHLLAGLVSRRRLEQLLIDVSFQSTPRGAKQQ
jgi:lysozyme